MINFLHLLPIFVKFLSNFHSAFTHFFVIIDQFSSLFIHCSQFLTQFYTIFYHFEKFTDESLLCAAKMTYRKLNTKCQKSYCSGFCNKYFLVILWRIIDVTIYTLNEICCYIFYYIVPSYVLEFNAMLLLCLYKIIEYLHFGNLPWFVCQLVV